MLRTMSPFLLLHEPSGPVLGVETHVRTVGDAPVTQTSGHVGDELQLLRIQHLLERKFVCGIKGRS